MRIIFQVQQISVFFLYYASLNIAPDAWSFELCLPSDALRISAENGRLRNERGQS